MKKIFVVYLYLFIISICSELNASEVNMGTNSLAVVFSDESLTDNEKAIIVKDVQTVLSTTHSSAKLMHFENVGKRKDGMTGRIDTGVKGHRWPRSYWKIGFGEYRLNKQKLIPELVISKNLSDAFRNAIEFQKKNRKTFDALDVFIARIAGGLNPKLMSLEDKKSLFWFPPGSPIWRKEKYYDQNITALNEYIFGAPSILDITEHELDGGKVFFCRTIYQSKHNLEFQEEIFFVYVGDKWCIRVF